MKLADTEIEFVYNLSNERLTFKLSGLLSNKSTGKIWQNAVTQVRTQKPKELILEASGLKYCDMTGIGFIQELKSLQDLAGASFTIKNFPAEYQGLFDLVNRRSGKLNHSKVSSQVNLIEAFGRSVANLGAEIYDQIVFVGSVTSQFFYALFHPHTIRWKDVWVFIEKGGVNAVPLIVMTGFLIGVIMAFQSALPLKQMGSDVFVANVVAFAVLRELGPLMTAIILAGRTGAAIAAEIGTMQINEEVNALTTMGLEPVRFLVISRMIGILFLAPLLTIAADFFGMLGGAVVFQSFGYSMVTYMNQITSTVDLGDLLGGIFKSIPFALAIGSIACLRGLKTKTGASAVGESTTSAVVTGMVMIILLDGIISAIYYAVGI